MNIIDRFYLDYSTDIKRIIDTYNLRMSNRNKSSKNIKFQILFELILPNQTILSANVC